MKKIKITVFILMIISAILPTAGVIIPKTMGNPAINESGTIGIIGWADGSTSIFVAGKWTPHIATTFIPFGVLFVLWFILHIKSKRKR